MIKINTIEIPEILQKNQQDWTEKLLFSIIEHKGYSSIPENIKNIVVNKYRHEEITSAVNKRTKGKCSFCESIIETVSYTNIEHFYPKSLYPKFTFKWSNLIPACNRCNVKKKDYDTRKNPFINPLKDNPEDLLYYKELKIYALQNNLKASNTLDKCFLNRKELINRRAEILTTFYDLEESIGKHNKHYNTLNQKAAKLKIADELLESIKNLNEIGGHYKSYAGYFRFLINNSQIIIDSLEIINTHLDDLQLPNNFDFDWN